MTRERARGGASAIRVLHVISTAEVGGGGEHLVALTSGLGSHGFESAVLVGRDGPAAARLRAAGVPVDVLGAMGPTTPLSIASRLGPARLDLLHLHGSRAGLFGAIAARHAGVGPVIYTAHMFSFLRRLPAPMRWMATRAEALTCAWADRVICVSQSDLGAAAGRGIRTAHFAVIPNGIEMARFPAREDRRAEFGFGPAAPVVGMIARLVPQKDPITFVHMAGRVAGLSPDARFLLVGDGPLRAEVERVGSSLIREGRLVLTGFRGDVPELLATMNVVVFPSLWEAQGIALIEAMAASRAVVATALSSHAEAVVHGETGLLVPPGDPTRLADEVSGLIADEPLRERIGRCARARVEGTYVAARMVEKTVAVYRSELR